MSIHLSSSLEPVTVLLLVTNLVVWSVHFFLQRRIGNMIRPK